MIRDPAALIRDVFMNKFLNIPTKNPWRFNETVTGSVKRHAIGAFDEHRVAALGVVGVLRCLESVPPECSCCWYTGEFVPEVIGLVATCVDQC